MKEVILSSRNKLKKIISMLNTDLNLLKFERKLALPFLKTLKLEKEFKDLITIFILSWKPKQIPSSQKLVLLIAKVFLMLTLQLSNTRDTVTFLD